MNKTGGIGRPNNIQSPEILEALFEEYKALTKNNPFKVHDYVGKDGKSVYVQKERALTLEGFENFLYKKGIIRFLGQYMSNREGQYDEFVEVCSYIKSEIRQDQIEGGMAGVYNPSITQRLNSLKEQTDVTSDNKGIDFVVKITNGNS